MKKQTLSILIITLLIASTISGCSKNNSLSDVPTLAEYIADINSKHSLAITQNATYDEAEYLIDVNSASITANEASLMQNNGTERDVNADEAKADVNTAFEFWRTSYGGYQYFGGDNKFIKAKELILEDIDTYMSEYNKTTINASELSYMIASRLNFIYDSHFYVGDLVVSKESFTYYEESELEFSCDDNGYYTLINDIKYYLPKDYESLMKVTIAKSGQLVYGLFAVQLSTSTSLLPKNITLNSLDDDTCNIECKWVKSESDGVSDVSQLYEEFGDVAYSQCNTFKLNEEDFSFSNQFINTSFECANHNYSIVDVRNNPGGNVETGLFWLYGYTGKLTDTLNTRYFFNPDYIDYTTDVSYSTINKLNIFDKNTDLWNTYYDYAYNKYDSEDKIVKMKGNFNIPVSELMNNEKTLFILQGYSTCSAAEHFVSMSKNIENTITVGTNSNGCFRFGSVVYYYLPNSGMRISYGTSVITGYENDFENHGFGPDIFIGGENAKDALLRCIEFYK